jgi:hypothetical protein
MDEKECKKDEKKGKDEKMGGKENGVGSGVIQNIHCLFFFSENYS